MHRHGRRAEGAGEDREMGRLGEREKERKKW